MIYKYFVFGLEVQSEFLLPELLPSTTTTTTTTTDVTILIGTFPSSLTNTTKKGVGFEIAIGEFILDLKDVARFYVKGGNTIIIEPRKGTENDIRLFLLGTCFGAILHQRKILALHASAIAHKGKAVLFTGLSGAGKSTMANAFRLQDFKMLTDDICPVQFINGIPYAQPGYPQSKLWEDALEKMEIEYQHLQYTSEGINKRRVPIINTFEKEPLRIKALYVLQLCDISKVETYPVTGTDKFKLIKDMTYREYGIKYLGMQSYHFMNSIQLANQIHITRIIRPQNSNIQEIMNVIKDDLELLE